VASPEATFYRWLEKRAAYVYVMERTATPAPSEVAAAHKITLVDWDQLFERWRACRKKRFFLQSVEEQAVVCEAGVGDDYDVIFFLEEPAALLFKLHYPL
jgi:hypothetical protein